jgi:plasmid stabilization system protein ParE
MVCDALHSGNVREFKFCDVRLGPREQEQTTYRQNRDHRKMAGCARCEAALRSAVENLATHPLIGRRVEGDLRELVISYGATGYIALYRFDIQRDQVRVLALRYQREVGYLS